MGVITAANFKLYQCATWAEGDTHGGVINTAAEINGLSGLTGTVTFAATTAIVGSGTAFTTQLHIGDKIYNYSDDGVKEAVEIASIESDTALTLISAYGGTIGSGKTAYKYAIWEEIFDSVSDAERIVGNTEYRKVFFRNENADTVSIKGWIETQYSAANETISICLGTDAGVQTTGGEGADGTYVTPNAIGHADALDCGSLIQNASKAVWIKRVVSAAGDGYVGDSFELGFGMY